MNQIELTVIHAFIDIHIISYYNHKYITKGSLWLATWVSLYEVKGGAAVLVCELPQL